jgi:hypothetical protein
MLNIFISMDLFGNWFHRQAVLLTIFNKFLFDELGFLHFVLRGVGGQLLSETYVLLSLWVDALGFVLVLHGETLFLVARLGGLVGLLEVLRPDAGRKRQTAVCVHALGDGNVEYSLVVGYAIVVETSNFGIPHPIAISPCLLVLNW